MRKSWLRLAYPVLATAFTVLGIMTFLNIAAAWRVGGVILWGAAAYAAMDFLIAYGLFKREWWTLHAFVLNLAGLAVLFGTNVMLYGIQATDPLFYSLALGINALLAAFLYYTCGRVRRNTLGDGAGAVFVLLWATMFCYTVIGNLS